MSQASLKITSALINDLATDSAFNRQKIGEIFASADDTDAAANWLDFADLEIADGRDELPIYTPVEIFQSGAEVLDISPLDQDDLRQPFVPISSIEGVNKLTSQQAIGDNPAFDLIGLTQLRNDPQFTGIDGSGFSVAVIDTGLDIDHPLIAPNYVAGYDFIDRDSNPNDTVGHGTHIAGTIGAIDETIGVATDAGLIALRALDTEGSAFVSKIEAALKWVYDNRQQYNITAVNLSLGTGFFTPESQVRGDILSDDIQRLSAAGVTVVAAAGNEYFLNEDSDEPTGIAFPAVFSTIAVGAVWQDDSQPLAVWQDGSIDFSTGADRIPGFSQRSQAENFIFAPGAIITSTLPNNRIGENAGTSQAVPHIAGAVALLQEASLQFSDRVLTPAEVNEILQATGDLVFDGDDEDDNVTNTETSYLRVNVYNAVTEIKRRANALGLSTGNSLNDIIPQIERSTSLPVSDRVGEIGRDETIVGNKDVDFYLFNLDEAGVLEIDVDSQTANLDTVISLFDRQGKRLAMQDNSSNDSSLRFWVDADTNYYLAITGFGNQDFDPLAVGSGAGGDTGIYSFDANLLTLASGISLTNNTIASPAVETITVGQTLFGNLGDDNGFAVGNEDIDFYRFIADTSESLRLDLTSEELDGDTYLRLFDASGQEIAASNDVSNNSIQFKAIASREYYLGVNGNTADTEYNPLRNNAAGSLGSYNLTLSRQLETSFSSEQDSVYRFHNRDTGVYFYTASTVERDLIKDNFSQYSLTGVPFESADPLSGAKPVYRFLNTATGTHLYTISEVEKDFIEDNLVNYQSNGIVYYGYEDRQPGTTPLYRLYNTSSDTHLFTSSSAEKNEILASSDYRLEGNNGVAFYVESARNI